MKSDPDAARRLSRPARIVVLLFTLPVGALATAFAILAAFLVLAQPGSWAMGAIFGSVLAAALLSIYVSRRLVGDDPKVIPGWAVASGLVTAAIGLAFVYWVFTHLVVD